MSKKKEVFSLIKKIGTIYDRDYNNIMKAYDLTASQCEALELLFAAKEDMTNRDLEQKMCLSNPTVAGILRRLEAKDFIEIEQMKVDRRKHRLILTDKALDLKDSIKNEKNKVIKNLSNNLTEEEFSELEGLLLKVFANV